MPKFSTGTAPKPDPLEQRFSFTGKVRGADVLLQLVKACGYEVVHEALKELKPLQPGGPHLHQPTSVRPKRRKPARPKTLPTESSVQPPAKDK